MEADMSLKINGPLKPDIFLFLVIFIGLSLGLLSIPAQKLSSPVSPWKGLKVFEEYGCRNCHSVYKEGGKGGPDLGKHKFYGTYLQLAALMWNHFPEMSKKMQKNQYQFSKLNTEEMAQLIAYLSFIRYRGEPGRESLGKKLLKSKGCVSCHKFGGKGGDIGPDIGTIKGFLSPLLLVESMWNHGPNMMELFQEHSIKRPEFKRNEIVHLAVAVNTYIPTTNKIPTGAYDLGDPVNGKKLIERKGCLDCHSIHDVGSTTLGSDFYEIDLDYSVTQIAGKMWNHGPKMWEVMKRENISVPTFEGQRVVNEGKCLSCHVIDKKGIEISKDLTTLSKLDSPLAMITAMWNHAPVIFEKHKEKKLKWPKLNDRDIANIYTYLHSLN
jgi:cytochrome c2